MKKRVSEKTWFPFWIDKWIFGSMRIEFNAEERGIWIDLYALATKDNGHIRANEDIPYPMEQLSGMLIIPKEKLEKAIENFIKKGKIERLKSGTLMITKWEKYQFSDRWTRAMEKSRASSGKTEECSGKKEPILYNRTKHNITKHNKKTIVPKEKKSPSVIKKINPDLKSKEKKWENITDKDMELWKKAYPACNIKIELYAMLDWLISNPTKQKSNYRSFISRWLKKQQDQGGSDRGGGRVRKEHRVSQVGKTPDKFKKEGWEKIAEKLVDDYWIEHKEERDLALKKKDKEEYQRLQRNLEQKLSYQYKKFMEKKT